jgi:hypothetical protein
MKHATLIRIVIFLLAGLIGPEALSDLAHAQSGGGYDLTWSTVASGGGQSTGGGYTLNGSIGQPNAGAALTGGGYTVVGGCWSSVTDQYRVFLPLVLRQ